MLTSDAEARVLPPRPPARVCFKKRITTLLDYERDTYVQAKRRHMRAAAKWLHVADLTRVLMLTGRDRRVVWYCLDATSVHSGTNRTRPGPVLPAGD